MLERIRNLFWMRATTRFLIQRWLSRPQTHRKKKNTLNFVRFKAQFDWLKANDLISKKQKEVHTKEQSMLVNDWLAVAISTLLSVAHIGACRLARKRALLSAAVSRKLIHIGTGVLYVGSWSLFSDDQQVRFLFACVSLRVLFVCSRRLRAACGRKRAPGWKKVFAMGCLRSGVVVVIVYFILSGQLV